MRDLYPESEDELAVLRKFCIDAFFAARDARDPHEEQWDRYDRHYEAYIKRERGDWRSKVYMPEVFSQIETIKPRLITQLPKMLANPIGNEDVPGAQVLTQLLEWSATNANLHLELVKTFHPTLLYGTGILKTFPDTRYAWGSEMVPVFQNETRFIEKPLIDPETQRQMLDIDNKPMFDRQPLEVQVPLGMRPQKKRYIAYDGPAAKAVNIRNFWVAPEAEDVDNARYVIHRVYRDPKAIQQAVKDGIYRWPEDASFDELWAQHDDPRITSLEALEKGSSPDNTRRQVELLEIWTNDGPDSPGRVITLANRRVILRVHENPFWHGQKPFVRFVDYLVPHRFWGIGEVQHMEGIQDAINAITNQHLDNERIRGDQMYAVNEKHLVDRSDLKTRPGGVIRVKGDGMTPKEVIEPLQMASPSSNPLEDIALLQQMGERTTAVSSYQQGVDTPSQLETATGAAMMHEAGTSRFALKAKLFEIDPLARIAQHFGSMLQQFTSKERVLRLAGPEGAMVWETISPESLQGGFDFTVEPMNAQQSETIKRQQALEIANQMAQWVQMGVFPPQLLLNAAKDVLEAMGAKSVLQQLDQFTQMQQAPVQPELPIGG